MPGKDRNAYLIISGSPRKKIPCMFNPTEFSLTLTNDWGDAELAEPDGTAPAPVPGKGVPTLSFKGSRNGSLSLTLFFDTTSQGVPVTNYTDEIVAAMEIDPNTVVSGAKRDGQPPTVRFGWGTMTSFPCVITSLTLRFTYFSDTGMPLRATMSLSLTQFKEARSYGKQNPTSGTPAPHRTHRVQPGESLDRISAQHFGDSTQWRTLAQANAIEDPLDLRPGSLIVIPRLDP